MYLSKDIKEKFLGFFKKNGHLEIDGSSVIPKNDPTLLYINAGMASIKNYFTGDEIPPQKELCDIQSCIRTIDIDDIGDRYHLTSFQMLGSWSIGSYFKERAIELAYDFLVDVLKIPVEKLYVSVFEGNENIGLQFDEESKKNWVRVGIPKNHIVSFGMEDNFWGPSSDTGPCGPCTEVFYDTGVGPEYKEGGVFDTSRYIEIWNAGVFMMFNKDSEGSFNKLAFNSVDTGAGLERLTMTLNGFNSVYDTDLLSPIQNFIGQHYEFNDNGRNIRILTDHLRTSCLILSEGQEISNEGRGYIPRKLIRKCISISKKNLKNNDFDISEVVEFIVNSNNDFKSKKEKILSRFNEEKEKFESIFDSGFEKLKFIAKNGKISSTEAFDLVTSFGFPFEFIKDYANENNIKIDEKEFFKLLDKHKEISRASVSSNEVSSEIYEKISDVMSTDFVGYSSLESKSKILRILDKNFNELQSCKKEDEVFVIFDRTPVYAKSGGQESDSAEVFSDNFLATVDYAIKKNGIFVHHCKIENGSASKNECVNIKIDKKIRDSHSRAHSCTHLLQSALKEVFGSEVHQKGSKVTDDSLHFDFNFTDKISRENLCEIERIVNRNICKNIPRRVEEMSLSDAVKSGATAIFSEKYGDKVRVVSFGDISKELCGGTHVERTGDIGTFIINSCESIGKGIKRISGYTSGRAIEYIQNIVGISVDVSEMLHVKINDLPKSISKFQTQKVENIVKKIDKSQLSFFKTKTPFAYFICSDNFSNSLVSDISESIKGIFLIMSSGKSRVSIGVCKKLDISAKDILISVLSNIGAKGGGNDKIASGGLPQNVGASDLVEKFRKKYENNI